MHLNDPSNKGANLQYTEERGRLCAPRVCAVPVWRIVVTNQRGLFSSRLAGAMLGMCWS